MMDDNWRNFYLRHPIDPAAFNAYLQQNRLEATLCILAFNTTFTLNLFEKVESGRRRIWKDILPTINRGLYLYYQEGWQAVYPPSPEFLLIENSGSQYYPEARMSFNYIGPFLFMLPLVRPLSH